MKKYVMRFFIFCAVFIILCGCGPVTKETGNVTVTEEYTQESDIPLCLADSLDRAVIQKIDETKQKITFYNLTLGKSYTLSYDNATGIKSRHDEELVVGQLQTGDIVEVTFIKEEKRLKNIWLDKTTSVTEDVMNFDINRTARTFEMNGQQYEIDAMAPVLSDGEVLTLMDINKVDTLRIVSVDRTIRSISITNGHGYVRLVGAEPFEGGWVEFGQSIIRKVEKDMLLLIPAGSYDMLISNEGIVGTKSVVVTENEETKIDVSDLIQEEENEDKIGGIIFTINPSDAVLKVDGQETDYSSVVNLSYGIHHIEASKEGYSTLSRYIKVGQEMANISINMEPADENKKDDDKEDKGDKENSNEDDDTSVSGNSAIAPSVGDGYKVYIDAPEGAELYVDGKYIGVLPTSFDKKSGTYTVSVRKSGYKTRSYSLEVDNSEKDVRYSFSSLEKEGNG
ncbi:MAG: PEGA domain-containing protein [Lachnospiraceae bacterium]|nr:PEGA domain-containing protein [Lachnospiraceae bacterium]